MSAESNTSSPEQTLTKSPEPTLTDFNHHLPLHIATLTSVRAGKSMQFAREDMSAIDNAPIKSPVTVNFMDLTTDAQADGTLGENLTTEAINGLPEMTESTVCIGDVFQYGGDFEKIGRAHV